MNRRIRNILVAFVALAGLITPAVAFASSDSTSATLNQTVNAGTLTTNIYESDDSTPVTSPAVSFPATNVSFACQTKAATLGDANNKVNVTNMAVNNGWTLTLAATGGSSATWSDGTHSYKFNDSAGTTAGCTNGQMTVDPSVATLTDDCSSVCSDATVTKGSSTAFSGSSSVTLMSNSSGAAWEGYLTGIGLSQKIPASQPAGSYSLGMTLTVTSN